MEVEYGVRMRPGDVITSVRRLSEYREREGRLGLMLFTTFEEVWTNQNGDLVKNSRFTLIRY
jgi:N-terminal half of MaoC dehydratase